MISLLRKTRQALLSQNKFLRYLVYVTGEIILVIVGILIALNINNNNEVRKNEEKVISILKQIRQELSTDIDQTTQLIEYYIKKDSLISLVLNERVSREDYTKSNSGQLIGLITTISNLVTLNNGYNHLTRNIDNMPPKFEHLINNLNTVYINDASNVTNNNERMALVAQNVLNKWAEKHEWYWKMSTGVMEKATIDFFLTDPFYKNDVFTYYLFAMQNHLPGIKSYRVNAIKSYIEISDLLISEGEDIKDNPSFIVDTNIYSELAGTYQLGSAVSVEVILDNNRLYGKTNTGTQQLELFPLSPSRFFVLSTPATIQFNKNAQGKVESITNFQNGQATILKKVID